MRIVIVYYAHNLTNKPQEATMDKAQQRKELEAQLAKFMANGGKVKKLKSKANPIQRKVTA